MSRDWSARVAAIAYFEKLVKELKRCNDDDKEIFDEALHALRRSQDHTAIQARLTSAVRCIRSIAQMPASTHEIDRQLCKEWLDANTPEGSG